MLALTWLAASLASDPPSDSNTYLDQGNYLDVPVSGSGIAPSAIDLWKEATRSAPVPEGAGLANPRGELTQGHTFPLPPGLLQPQLGLTYSTGTSSHSWVGRGWSLSTGLTVQQPTSGGERAYVGDGVRDVLLVSGDGLDGMFVATSDGWRWESATPSIAGITFLGNGDLEVVSGTRRWTLQETTMRTWRTVQTQDRAGNLIDYTWAGSRLDGIDYGGTVSGTNHNVHVVPVYEAAAHASWSATHGELEVIDQRLRRVEVHTPSFVATGANNQLQYVLSYRAEDAHFADDELLETIEEADPQRGVTRLRARFDYHTVDLDQYDEQLIDPTVDAFDPGTSQNARNGPGFVNETVRGLHDYSRDGLPDVVGPNFEINPMVRDPDDFGSWFWSAGDSTDDAFQLAKDAVVGSDATVVNVRVYAEQVGSWGGGPLELAENGTYRSVRMVDVDGDGLLDRVRNRESSLLDDPLGYSFDGNWSHDLAIAQLYPDRPVHEHDPGFETKWGTWTWTTQSFPWEVCWGHSDPAVGFSDCDVVPAPFATPGAGTRVVLPQWEEIDSNGYSYSSIDHYDTFVDLADMNADGWLDVVFMEREGPAAGALYYYPYQQVAASDDPIGARRTAGWAFEANTRVNISISVLNGAGEAETALVRRRSYLDRVSVQTGETTVNDVASFDHNETRTTTADLNGDGLVDLIVADELASGWSVYFGNGAGFEASSMTWPAPQMYVEKAFEGRPHVTSASAAGGLGAGETYVPGTAWDDPLDEEWVLGGGTSVPYTCFDLNLCDPMAIPANSFLPVDSDDACDDGGTPETVGVCSQDMNLDVEWERPAEYLENLQSPDRPVAFSGSVSESGGEDAYVASGLIDMDADGRPDFFDGWNHVWHRNLGDGFDSIGQPIPSWWPTAESADYGVHEVLSASYTSMKAGGGYQGAHYLQQGMGFPSTTRTWTLVMDLNGDKLPDGLVNDGPNSAGAVDRWVFAGGIEPQQPPGALESVVLGTGVENHFEYMSSTQVREAGHFHQLVPESVENHIVRPLLATTSLRDPFDVNYTSDQWRRSYAYEGAYCDVGTCWGFDTIVSVDESIRKKPDSNDFVPINETLPHAAQLHRVATRDHYWFDLSGARLWSSEVYNGGSHVWPHVDATNLVYQQSTVDYTPDGGDQLVQWATVLHADEWRPNSSQRTKVERTYDAFGNVTSTRLDAGPLPAPVTYDPIHTVLQTRSYVGSSDGVLWLPEQQHLFRDDGSGTLIEDERLAFAYDDGSVGATPTKGQLTTQYVALDPSGGGTNLSWSFGYDDRGQVDHEVWPNGLTFDRTWNEFGGTQWSIETVSGDFGAWVTTQDVDELGRVSTVDAPNGNETHTTYDAFGRMLQLEEVGAGPTSDTLIRQSRGYVDADFTVVPRPAYVLISTPRYDDQGVQTGTQASYVVMDAMGREAVTWEADEQGQGSFRLSGHRRGVHGQDEATWTTTAGAFIPQLGIIEVPFNWGHFHLASWSTFDRLGEVSESWTAETGSTTFARVDAGWVNEASTDNGGVGDPSADCRHADARRLHYDARGRLLEVFQGDPTETFPNLTRTGTYSYDATGRILTFTNGEGQKYRYNYDGAGRLEQVETREAGAVVPVPGGFQELYNDWVAYTYADAGPKPTSMTDVAGGATTWTYDDLGRPLTQTVTGHTGNETTIWTYDTYPDGSAAWLGAVTHVSFPTAHGDGELSYRYDPVGSIGQFGWVTEESQFLPGVFPADDRTYTFGHDYDGQGWVIHTSWPDQPTGALDVWHEYHVNGLQKRHEVKVAGTPALAYDMLYDEWGQLEDWSLDHTTDVATGSTIRSAAGRVDGLFWNVSGTSLDVDYEYCGEDERIAVRRHEFDDGIVSDEHELRYAYDRLGRIAEVLSVEVGGGASGLAERYGYDNANRTTFVEVPAAGLLERHISYSDATGNPTSIEDSATPPTTFHTLQHDTAHRLTQDVRGGGATFTYAYDGSSRLMSAAKNATSVDYWYAPGDRIPQEVRSSGSEVHRFKGYQERSGVSYADVLPWLTLKDGLPQYTLAEPDGRASMVVSPAGAVEAQRFVSAYGVELSSLAGYPGYSPTGDWPLDGLHGSEPDDAMGVTHFGARHMAMRGDGLWMQREPLLASYPNQGQPKSPLAYGQVYAAGNTNLFADPAGTTPGHAAVAWAYTEAALTGADIYATGATVFSVATGGGATVGEAVVATVATGVGMVGPGGGAAAGSKTVLKNTIVGRTMKSAAGAIDNVVARVKGACFVADTAVVLVSGDAPIQDARAGDRVLTRDPAASTNWSEDVWVGVTSDKNARKDPWSSHSARSQVASARHKAAQPAMTSACDSAAAAVELPSDVAVVKVYDARTGAWEHITVGDLEVGDEVLHSGHLLRVTWEGVEDRGFAEIEQLREADATWTVDRVTSVPDSDDWVLVLGDDAEAGHWRLQCLTIGVRFAFRGRVFETAVVDGELAFRATEQVLAEVVQTFKRMVANEVLDLQVAFPDGEKAIITGTHDHPFFVPALDRYLPLGELEPGTVLLTSANGEAVVVDVARRMGDFEVFNIEVAEAHTYFVRGAGIKLPGVLVHNKPMGNPFLLRSGAPGEMTEEAIKKVKSLPPGERADAFDIMAGQIEDAHPGDWVADRIDLEDGSTVFLGGVDDSLLLTPDGKVFHGKNAHAGDYTGVGSKMKPNLDNMVEK